MDGDGHAVGKVLSLEDHSVTVSGNGGMAIFIFDVDVLVTEGFFEKTVEGAEMTAGTLNLDSFGSNFCSFGSHTMGAGHGEMEKGDLSARVYF